MEVHFKLISLLILIGICSALRNCKNHELCVTKQRCDESDDSGRHLIGPRILDNSCGVDQVCCEKQQLEDYDRSLAHSTREAEENICPTTSEQSFELLFKMDYKSCNGQDLCVPRHLCKTGSVNEDGRYILKPRTLANINSTCSTFEICCPVGDQQDESENALLRNLEDFKYKGCGYSNPKGLIYDLVGYTDHETHYAEYPWMVALMDMQSNYVCGGTLIHPQLVLTSAHNVANHSSATLLARAGDYDLSVILEPLTFQTRRLSYLWRHEMFNKLNFHNDIALIVLEHPFKLAPHIQPICLPPAETSVVQAALLQAQCFATGWGQRNISTKSLEHILKVIELPIVEHQRCQTLLRQTVLGLRYRLHESFICAGGVEGKDTCKGDGGSPLFCSLAGQSNRYQLAGIVSWGIECAEKDFPAAYTNVPHLRTWIDAQVAKTGLKLDEP